MTQALHSTHPAETPLLQVKDLVREYTLPRDHLFKPPGKVHALNGVNFSIASGRSLGIVGESGSGKSTLARLVMALDAPTSGTVELLGRNLHQLPAEQLRQARRDFQMVFQDPYGSLDPRQTVERIVTALQAIRLMACHLEGGTMKPGGAPGGVFQTADGWMSILAINDRQRTIENWRAGRGNDWVDQMLFGGMLTCAEHGYRLIVELVDTHSDHIERELSAAIAALHSAAAATATAANAATADAAALRSNAAEVTLPLPPLSPLAAAAFDCCVSKPA